MEKGKRTHSEYLKAKKLRQRKRKILRASVYMIYYGFWTIIIALVLYFSYSFISSKFGNQARLKANTKDIVMYNDESFTDNDTTVSHSSTVSNSKSNNGNDSSSNQPRKQEIVNDGTLVVCIDAGHGGKDRGCNRRKRSEKNDTLKLALEIQKYLNSQGIKVVMTRSKDNYLTLQERVDICSSKKCDYFISLHRNCGNGNGYETWLASDACDEAKELANNIHTGMVDVGVSKDRNVKTGSQKNPNEDYFVLRNTTTPACLLELGFLNNSTDNKYFDSNTKAYAKAISDAIISTYNKYHSKNTKK
ncbi:N-acetylmuramoyl-L-alanine amidase [Lachnobacterium bovis]|uniref:N-acetylmuramoyl-L-alanine amidase n=1 Tax=Lachnobacterium bovis DSM 14045 TaxID=1122142 RepID=A0A1H3IZ33_9FIRM|nr:N-acetylmuramoyl-L-alanine amidase [Lachnobacterium bovis]SDY32817.1 N-acetylmuramoyl-L-alanine amidase [Lachnobacterium bovis DSM 14045]